MALPEGIKSNHVLAVDDHKRSIRID